MFSWVECALMANQQDLEHANSRLCGEIERLRGVVQLKDSKLATAKAEIEDLQDQLRQAKVERNEFAVIAQKAVAALEKRG